VRKESIRSKLIKTALLCMSGAVQVKIAVFLPPGAKRAGSRSHHIGARQDEALGPG
jgi:hypothetical protein